LPATPACEARGILVGCEGRRRVRTRGSRVASEPRRPHLSKQKRCRSLSMHSKASCMSRVEYAAIDKRASLIHGGTASPGRFRYGACNFTFQARARRHGASTVPSITGKSYHRDVPMLFLLLLLPRIHGNQIFARSISQSLSSVHWVRDIHCTG